VYVEDHEKFIDIFSEYCKPLQMKTEFLKY